MLSMLLQNSLNFFLHAKIYQTTKNQTLYHYISGQSAKVLFILFTQLDKKWNNNNNNTTGNNEQ